MLWITVFAGTNINIHVCNSSFQARDLSENFEYIKYGTGPASQIFDNKIVWYISSLTNELTFNIWIRI